MSIHLHVKKGKENPMKEDGSKGFKKNASYFSILLFFLFLGAKPFPAPILRTQKKNFLIRNFPSMGF